MLSKSFLGNHGLQMSGFWDTRGQSHQWRHYISNGCSYFSKYVNLCTINLTPIKIFSGQRCTVFWGRSHSSVSSTSYVGLFQNEERSRIQVFIFKSFMCLFLKLSVLQTLLFTTTFDSVMHAFEAFFAHENHAYPVSLSEYGKVRKSSAKSDFLQCLNGIVKPSF